MQSQHVLEKTEKLTTIIFRQNGLPFFADSLSKIDSSLKILVVNFSVLFIMYIFILDYNNIVCQMGYKVK